MPVQMYPYIFKKKNFIATFSLSVTHFSRFFLFSRLNTFILITEYSPFYYKLHITKHS